MEEKKDKKNNCPLCDVSEETLKRLSNKQQNNKGKGIERPEKKTKKKGFWKRYKR